ncbi:MAG: hypothetical protein H6624_07300 [Bdellovibrionaceae bacterium]|nr:hypothetical protein [Bdellovibrionales bacterium]MCB9084134.1 hypothetical protein [Pseudobdellovibrionaceae bacterium]
MGLFKKPIITSLIIGACLLFGFQSHALMLDSNLFYISDSLDVTDQSFSRHGFDLSLAMGLDQDSMLNLGVNVSSMGTMDSTGATEVTWSTLDYGVKFIAFLDRVKTWGLGLAYNLKAQGKYESGGSELDWRGSSLKFDIGYNPLVFNGFYFGVRLSYYMAMYNEESTDGGSSYTSKDVKRSFIYPSIYLSYRLK